MNKINKELLDEIKDVYGKYTNFMEEKAELTSHNRAMKRDFVDINFEDAEADEKKNVSKQITKYFRAIDEVGSGSDPVIEVKELRKEHLDFEDDLYEKLMQIKKQIDGNIVSKDKIDTSVKALLVELSPKMAVSYEVVKGIFEEEFKLDKGKYSVLVDISEGHRKLRDAIDNGVE